MVSLPLRLPADVAAAAADAGAADVGAALEVVDGEEQPASSAPASTSFSTTARGYRADIGRHYVSARVNRMLTGVEHLPDKPFVNVVLPEKAKGPPICRQPAPASPGG